jgi:hypothetical protein
MGKLRDWLLGALKAKKEAGPWGDKDRPTEKRRKEIRIASYAFL